MKQLFRLAVSITLLCVFTINVCAWNGVGHMTVAGIAYRELQQNDQATLDRINTLLRSHRSYSGNDDKWVTEYNGYSQAKKDKISLEAYVFMRAAAWPDDVRSKTLIINGKSVNTNDWKPWHYINYPVRLPDTVDKDPLKAEIDILRVFAQQAAILQNSHSSKEEKARSLSWIFHLIGDAHQPLHGAALVNDHFKKGDHGGNSICVHAASQPRTEELHAFWDNVLRANGSARTNGENAWADAAFFRGLAGSNPDIGTATGSDGMKMWAKDSANIALRSAYQFHNETPGFIDVTSGACISDQTVSTEYEIAATNIARRRMALAGLRLAEFLRSVF